MDAVWIKLFDTEGGGNVWIVAAFVISSLLGYLTARGTSKDKVKSSMLLKTIDRQDALDIRQRGMMDDLQIEIDRVKTEMVGIREESKRQQKTNFNLSEKYSTMLKENHSLQSLIVQLQADKDELNEIVKELAGQNASLLKKIEQLTKEFRGKKERG